MRMALPLFKRRPGCTRTSVVHASYVLILFIGGLYLTMFTFTSVRNTLLYPILPGMWREVPSGMLQTLYMAQSEYDVGACPHKCKALSTPTVPRPDLRTRDVQMHEMSTTDGDQGIPDEAYWKFMPLLSRQEKLDQIYFLDVLVEVLERLQVDHFLGGGTLIGVFRHRGMIPWDDDVDVFISGRHWAEIKDALCCLAGFTVSLTDSMHWKFFKNDSYVVRTAPEQRFPFVDIFFYDENDDYLWIIPHFARNSLLTKKSNVFPLVTNMFEGKQYRVPRLAKKLLTDEFEDLSVCVSPSNLHRVNHALSGSDIVKVPCSELKHMYTIYDVTGE